MGQGWKIVLTRKPDSGEGEKVIKEEKVGLGDLDVVEELRDIADKIEAEMIMLLGIEVFADKE